MKKMLLLAVACVFGATASFAQCTSDPAAVAQGPGVYPDTATGLVPATVGMAYQETVTMVVPADTTVDGADLGLPPGPINLTITSIDVTDVAGLPGNFQYACNPADCKYLGGTDGCMLLSGTPVAGDLGTHPLVVYIDQQVVFAGAPMTVSDSVTYYSLVVNDGTTGYDVVRTDRFDAIGVFPNPVTETAVVNFSYTHAGNVTFNVFDLVGNVVMTQNVAANAGVNKINLDASDLPAGVYTYQLNDGASAITKRMVIAQ